VATSKDLIARRHRRHWTFWLFSLLSQTGTPKRKKSSKKFYLHEFLQRIRWSASKNGEKIRDKFFLSFSSSEQMI